MQKEIQIIDTSKSKYRTELIEKHQENIPIGIIDDIEVVFLHYKDPSIAKEKWERRRKRVNLENLIFKFSYMSNCSDELVKEFYNIPGEGKKLFFSGKSLPYNNVVIIPGNSDGSVDNDTFYWNKYLNIIQFINCGRV